MIHFVIPVEPSGQMRPRSSARGGYAKVYKAPKQAIRETYIESAWVRAGEPCIEAEGAIRCDMTFYLARPKGHFKKDGSLSAAGKRMPWPTKKPDTTNITKMIEDVLNHVGAWPDDKNICGAMQWKLWADHPSNPRDGKPCTVVHANLLPTDGGGP